MPVLRDLANDITRAVGIPELAVEPMARSADNMTMLLRGGGEVFFAKIYTDTRLGGTEADLRYDREKEILQRRWQVPTPTLVYSADTERVLVTREVAGHGFKHFMDAGRTLEALGMMARWVAGFHGSAEVQPRDETLWDHFSRYDELKGNTEFAKLKNLLQDIPLTEYVLTKGDCAAQNFKFNENGAIGLDFEAVAYRAKEFDFLSMIRGLHALTGESISDMVDVIVQQYATVRGIADADATAAAVKGLVRASDY